jgi:hypothetical protein
MTRVKPIDQCKTPRDFRNHAHAARPGEVHDVQRGRHNGIEVDGAFIPLGNRPNQELPDGTRGSIKRSFIARKLVVVTAFVGFLLAVEIQTGLVSLVIKAL